MPSLTAPLPALPLLAPRTGLPTRSGPSPHSPRRPHWRLCVLGVLGALCALLLSACGSTPPARDSVPGTLSARQSADAALRALGLVGTPYRWGGNTPESGFDCSGLIAYVLHSQNGRTPPRTVAQLAGFGQAVRADGLRSGDLVVFGADPAWHAGIYVGEGRFVHAPSTGKRVRVDRLNNPYWARQPVRFRRP